MKWVKRVLLSLLVLVLLIVGISFFLPKTAHVERSTTINARPDVVFNIVNDLKTYDKWMTWNQMDPNWKVKISENTIGKGAWYSWESDNRNVGKGSMTITDSKPNEMVTSDLAFAGMGISKCGYKLAPDGGGTKINWYMNSDMGQASFINGVMGKWMTALGFMDKMAGAKFDKSLASLKKLAETPETAQLVPATGNGSGAGYYDY